MKARQYKPSDDVLEAFHIVRNPVHGKCPVAYCRNSSPRGRWLCWKHSRQLWAHRHPDRYYMANLRGNAKKRGIEFKLSLEEIQNLASDFGWDWRNNSPIKFGDKFSIDRIDPTKGYVAGNVKGMTVSDNVRKGNRERHASGYMLWLESKMHQEAEEEKNREEEEWDGLPW